MSSKNLPYLTRKSKFLELLGKGAPVTDISKKYNGKVKQRIIRSVNNKFSCSGRLKILPGSEYPRI